MASVYRRILRGTPTYTSCSDFRTAVNNNNSTAYCSVLYDRTYFICLYRRFHYVFKCSETYLVPVSRPRTIVGVSSNVISGVCRKIYKVGCECSCAVSIGCYVVVYCRIWRGAPTYASLSYGCTAVGNDFRFAFSFGLRDAVDGYRRNHRHQYLICCRETFLVTVGRPYTIGGVSSHVIGGVLIQTCDAGVICSYASTIRGLIVVYCRILRCAPADTSFGHVRTTIGDDIAATSREGQRYILHRTSLYDRFLCLECHERVHLTSRGTVRGITFETVIIFCLGTEVVDIDMKSTFADINFRRYGIGKIVFFTVNYFHVVWYDTECV